MDSSFATLTLQSSITYNAANPNAVDKTTPLPFLDWVKHFASVSSDSTFLLSQYKLYINAWFSVQTTSTANKQDIVQNLYLSLFKDVALNYLTQEERRFIQNVNVNSPSEITAVLPLLVRKIKDICLYFASQRENVKHAVYDNNIKGSLFSIDKTIADVFAQSFLNPDIAKMFADVGITPGNVKNKLSVELEPLYDLETNYFDINPALPASAYEATDTRALYFSANSYDFDPDLFVDFDVSVVKAIQSYPVVLQELGNNLGVNLNFTADDLQYLKDEDYTSLVNDLNPDNLRLQSLRDALQHFSGSTFYYLSTNTNLNFTYGKLFDSDKFSNYLNRRFPTVAAVESDKLATESSVGRFFRPDKLGILNYLSFGLNGQITALSADYIYVFPDPSVYGNISGLSRSKLETPFVFSEDVSVLKNNNSNSYAFGRALSDFLTKFRGYQSRSESLNYDATGISRIQDSTDFFTGGKDTIWANPDVFPPVPYNFLPIEQRKQTLLNNLYTKALYQHKTDIYNNTFAFYKEIYPVPNAQSLVSSSPAGELLTCLTLDGHTFWDTVSGYNFDFSVADPSQNYSGVTTYTNGLTSLTASDYILQCILLYPESAFYKTVVTFNLTLMNGYNFGSYTPDATVEVLSCGTFSYAGLSGGFYTYIHYATEYNSGPFLFGNEDASFIPADRSLIENNLVLGQTLTAAETVVYDITGALLKDVSLYDQQNLYGDLYFRNYNGTVITTASAALSAVLLKYEGDILDQITNNLKGFDLVLDTAIFETDNYLVFERLVYDYNITQYVPQPDKLYIKKASTVYSSITSLLFANYTDYNQFSNTWYNESDGTILVSTTTLLSAGSATNARQIAIDLYEYDFESLRKLTVEPMCIFALSAAPVDLINIVSVEKPFLNYNKCTGNYVIKFISKDPSAAFYDTTIYFKLDKDYTPYDVKSYTLYPNMFSFSDNYGSNALSLITQTAILYGSNDYVGLSGNSLII